MKRDNPKLLPLLEESLHRRTRVALHREQKPLPVEPKRNPNEKPSCLDARVCLCGQVGDCVHKGWVKLRLHLRRMYASTSLKSHLEEGFVVWRFHTEGKPVPEEFDGGPVQLVGTSSYHFVHVSYVHGNPWFPVFRILECPNPDPDHLGHVHLRATHSYDLIYPFLTKTLQVQHVAVLHVKSYSLLDVKKPLDIVDPMQLEVYDTPNLVASAVVLWQPPSKKQQRRSVAAAWQSELSKLDSDSSSGQLIDCMSIQYMLVD
jgi:hypothetical protein